MYQISPFSMTTNKMPGKNKCRNCLCCSFFVKFNLSSSQRNITFPDPFFLLNWMKTLYQTRSPQRTSIQFQLQIHERKMSGKGQRWVFKFLCTSIHHYSGDNQHDTEYNLTKLVTLGFINYASKHKILYVRILEMLVI